MRESPVLEQDDAGNKRPIQGSSVVAEEKSSSLFVLHPVGMDGGVAQPAPILKTAAQLAAELTAAEQDDAGNKRSIDLPVAAGEVSNSFLRLRTEEIETGTLDVAQPAPAKTAEQLAAELTAAEDAATTARLAREAAVAAQPAGYTALPVTDDNANDGGSDDENDASNADAHSSRSRATAAFHALLSLPYEVTRALWRHPKTVLYCAAVATVVALEVMGCKGGLGKRSEEECYNVGLAFGTEKREGMAPASNSTAETPVPDVIPGMPTVNTATKVIVPALTAATAASAYAFFKCFCAPRHPGYLLLNVPLNVGRDEENRAPVV